jgi:hypothetical protein
MMPTFNFLTNKAIILYYPPFAGGKFIMNCLSLSQHAVPQCRKVAKHLIKNPTDYTYRLDAVLSTLPPKNKMREWRSRWEFGDTEFYQGDVLTYVNNWKQGITTNASTDQLLAELIENNMCFFITAHGGGINQIKALADLWKNARIIGLINHSKFWNIAKTLKRDNNDMLTLSDYAGNDCEEKYNEIKGPDWPEWNVFEKCHYNVDKVVKYVTISDDIKEEMKTFYQWNQIKNQIFCLDVDNSYFNKAIFLDTIKQLYDWVGFTDYNPDLLEQYYHQYIMLHQN